MRLARQHNLRRREACSARPKPHSLLSLLSVVELALLDPPEPPPEQDLVRLASNNRSSNSNRSSSSSSRLGPGSVRSVKLNHNNRLASALADSALRSRSSSSNNNNNNSPAVSSAQVPMLSVKSLPGADSVWALRFKFTPTTDTSKAPQPQALVPLVPELESLVRRSPRLPLPLVLLPSNPRRVLLAPGDSVLVGLEARLFSLNLTGFP